jgi:hypothetical protein
MMLRFELGPTIANSVVSTSVSTSTHSPLNTSATTRPFTLCLAQCAAFPSGSSSESQSMPVKSYGFSGLLGLRCIAADHRGFWGLHGHHATLQGTDSEAVYLVSIDG